MNWSLDHRINSCVSNQVVEGNSCFFAEHIIVRCLFSDMPGVIVEGLTLQKLVYVCVCMCRDWFCGLTLEKIYM